MIQNTSKRKKKQAYENIKFSDGTELTLKPGQVAGIKQKAGMGIHKIPKEKLSTELPQETSDSDEYDSLKYPPPQKDKDFRKIWAEGIENLSKRDNFSTSHLGLFETYCSVLVTLRRLNEFISQNGTTHRVVTATGEIRRTHPEVLERSRAISQIATYAKLLDLLPKKDKSKTVDPKEKDKWD